jgi:hypothetical protein
MKKFIVTCMAGLMLIGVSARTRADPSICVHALTDVEILFRVRQDAYFTRNAQLARHMRIDYDSADCGYRIHVGEPSPASRDGDLLIVDATGRVTRVVNQH